MQEGSVRQIEFFDDELTKNLGMRKPSFCILEYTCYNASVKFLFPLLVVLITVFAVAPLEYPGAIQSQTGLLNTYNLINLDQAPLQIFNWAPTVGRAYDLFRTDGALAYVAAEFFHLIGIGFLDATKLVIALAWIASGLAMYGLARRFLSQAGALLASAVYVYLPYHVATVYVRGAFAESVAWAIFPIALLAAVTSVLDSNNPGKMPATRRRQALSLLPFALLFLTQPGLAVLFGLFSFAVVAMLCWTSQRALKLARDVICHSRWFGVGHAVVHTNSSTLRPNHRTRWIHPKLRLSVPTFLVSVGIWPQ